MRQSNFYSTKIVIENSKKYFSYENRINHNLPQKKSNKYLEYLFSILY